MNGVQGLGEGGSIAAATLALDVDDQRRPLLPRPKSFACIGS